MSSFKLTETFIRTVASPKAKQKDYCDSKVPGLTFRVTHRGAKSWTFRYRFASKGKRLKIGPYPAISLKEARSKGREIQSQLSDNIDPSILRRNEMLEMAHYNEQTFGRLSDRFMREHEQGIAHYDDPDNNEPRLRGWKETGQMLDNDVLPFLGAIPATDIKRADIRRVVATVSERSESQANKVFATIRKQYNWAMNEDLVETSPCAGMKKPHKPKVRNNPLKDDEIRLFWDLCLEMGYPYGDAFRLLLVTGQRLNEVFKMTSDELDLKHLEWHLGSERTKAKRGHIVPITPLAKEILDNLPSLGGEFLFSTTMGVKPIVSYSRKIASIRQSIDSTHVKVHDLRETMATIMRSRLTVSKDVVGQVLNHAPQGVTETNYASLHSLPDKRAALMKWDRYLDGVVNETVADNIIQFPGCV